MSLTHPAALAERYSRRTMPSVTRMMNPRRRKLVGRWLIGGAIYSLVVTFAAGAGGALGYDGEVLGVTLAMALMPLCLGNVIVLGLFILWGER